MDNFRADGPGRGGKYGFAARDKAPAPNSPSSAAPAHVPDGDVIRGLRSGLIFSLAIWAMLFGVGTLFFG
jgi:hypothetical protein